jgi:hypothetical protein
MTTDVAILITTSKITTDVAKSINKYNLTSQDLWNINLTTPTDFF